jgi:hypothetical protein
MKNITEYFSETVSNVFILILSLCEKLIDLNFSDMFLTRKCLTALFCSSLLESCMSSTLVILKINVVNILDILFLLDGRLKSLSTLMITVSHIDDEVKLYIGPRVSMISIFMFREKHSKLVRQISILHFIFFIEKIAQIEMFFINCFGKYISF